MQNLGRVGLRDYSASTAAILLVHPPVNPGDMLAGQFGNHFNAAHGGYYRTGGIKVFGAHGDHICDNRDFNAREIRDNRDRLFCGYRKNVCMTDPQREFRLWLKAKVDERGHGTKGELARALKLKPDAITRMLNTDPKKESRQIKAHEIAQIFAFFETSADDAPKVRGSDQDMYISDTVDRVIAQMKDGPLRPSQDRPNASPPVPVTFPGDIIPMMGHAVGGLDGKFVLNGQRVMDTFSPPQLVGVSGAYGVFVHGDSMEPRYFAGEAVFVNPHLPVRTGDFAIVQISGEFEGDDVAGYVKRFVSMNSREIVLEQFKPREDVDNDAPPADRYTLRFPRNRVIAVHKIIQSGIV